jgi:hypothetical protein
VTAHGTCGIPSTAAAITVNVTATEPTAAGYLTLHSGNESVPLTSTVDFGPGQTRAGNALLALRFNGSGTLSISPFVADEGTVHVILDVTGYFD